MKKILIIVLSLLTIILCGTFFISFNNTSIPKLYFEGDLNGMASKEDERIIEISYKSDDINFDAYASVKLQGTSSLGYEKKNYTIKLYDDKQCDEKKKVDFGWGEQNKYCLKANWIDKTHSRNIVTAKLFGQAQDKYNVLTELPNNGAIDGYPVEIYLNGEFHGLYTLNIPKDKWMFNMDDKNLNHIAFSNEGWSPTNLFEEQAKFGSGDWENEIRDETEEDYIKLNRLIKFVKDSSDEEFVKNFNDYLDLDSTLNYFVIMDTALLADNVAKNMILITYDGYKWYPVLYDLDTSWGTHWSGTKTYEYNESIIDISLLWKRINRNFSNELSKRYEELRETILDEKNILDEFTKFKKSIPTISLLKENKIWKNIPGYNYSQIEEFLNVRLKLLDEKYLK